MIQTSDSVSPPAMNEAHKQHEDVWDPPVPLDHLDPSKQLKVRQLLREMSNVFSRDEKDENYTLITAQDPPQ